MTKLLYRYVYCEKEIYTVVTNSYILCVSRTQDAYQSGYDALKEYCRAARKSACFAYFEKNWHSCRIMWSNYARGKLCTAGNTTTNRIESNCKYLKMLLGLKTRIDKTLAGLLQHQMITTVR
ncbi:hypothetical protein AM587_10001302 [Phytophthora nicotianae]|uniref:Uncharacterized protein n=1 Tax=Phytophthora nicotianae TaxID=4792 RepID=A0A0W8CAR1_PHYNI|nr:hypothetical protein AM587_10001302 [Phytophthora nicotianae]